MESPAPIDSGSAEARPVPGTTADLAARIFAQKTEAELLYLAQNAGRYAPAVVAAAVAELRRRELLPDIATPRPAAAAPSSESWPELFWQLVQGLFLPTRRFFATPLLIDLNVIVFGIMVLSGISAHDPTAQELIRWGSNVTSRTLYGGEYWRLFTCMFLHAGTAHLLMNMFSLWLLGVLIEGRVGAKRMLAVYLVSGLGGGVASLWYHTAGINSVGASGAIFGLYGFLLTLLVSRRLALDKSDRRAMFGLVLYLVLSNLISGLTGNIDNAAHLGGLLTGLLLAGPVALIKLKMKN